MTREQLERLADEILSGQASEEDITLYIRWFNEQQGDFINPISDAESKKKIIYNNILRELHQPKVRLGYLLKVAAVVTFICTAGLIGYRWFHDTGRVQQKTRFATNDIKAGGNKATLTLSNGKQIILDNANLGQVAVDRDVVVRKTKSGQLVYEFAGNRNEQLSYQLNTISTPRGGQYQVVLPDGTHVWLNAASSLRFPSRFNSNNRDVQLTGEAYFEVAKDKAHPFHVISATQNIEVLGTHFNVNSYTDEQSVKTTLLEGSVKVTSGNAISILKPGEQSLINNAANAAIRINNSVNPDEVLAWKDGKFRFNQTDIQTLMRQISRWYDVDVVYEGKIPDDKFTGTLSRSVNLSKVLKLLQFTGLDFKIEGRKLLVK